MRIVVAGGTGLVGTLVIADAERRGHDVKALARSQNADLLTGEGVTNVLSGADVVIDVTNVATLAKSRSQDFFRTATTNLLAAEAERRVDHHIVLSIVGIDNAPDGYYAGKVLQEELVEASEVPWTIQRATQFHEFARQMYDSSKVGPTRMVPKMRTQPIAATEVATALVNLAESGPVGRAQDLGGPREESLVDMVRTYASKQPGNPRVIGVPIPGRLGRAQRTGLLLPGPDAQRGTQTFGEWIADL